MADKKQTRSYEEEIKKLSQETDLEKLKDNINFLKSELKEVKASRTYLPAHDPLIKMLNNAIQHAEKNKAKIQRQKDIAHQEKQVKASKQDDEEVRRSIKEREQLEQDLKKLRKNQTETQTLFDQVISLVRAVSLIVFERTYREQLDIITEQHNTRYQDDQRSRTQMAEVINREAEDRARAIAPRLKPGLSSRQEIIAEAQKQSRTERGAPADMKDQLTEKRVITIIVVYVECQNDPSLVEKLKDKEFLDRYIAGIDQAQDECNAQLAKDEVTKQPSEEKGQPPSQEETPSQQEEPSSSEEQGEAPSEEARATPTPRPSPLGR